MKKLILFAGLIFISGSVFAKPVSDATARAIASGFYRQATHNEISNLSLAYTARGENGSALYYAYNINSGFVIISADDAAQPVIGYSTEGNFILPESRSTIATWLKFRGEEITFIQKNNLAATSQIAEKWNAFNYASASSKQFLSTASVVTPIISTTWNQSPNYNAMCPNGSVTGCVATAMAQIMKYWNYPTTGNGSSSYNSNYGFLSCDYGNTTYNWANMPNAINGPNSDVALINYHCGVSVEMDYSPSGSGAWVCSFDNSVCAENSYKNYFRYDPNLLHSEGRWNFADSIWLSMIKADLDLGRPVQYVGWDPNAGGHTWVCDGYDQNNFLHMNWGWGGSGNGYYFMDNLTPNGLNFSDGHEAVLGIVPLAAAANDITPIVKNPIGYFCTGNFSPLVKLQNFGSTVLTAATINYSLDNGPAQTINWSGTLVTGQFDNVSLPSFVAAPGSHTLVVNTSNPNGSADGNPSNDQMVVTFHVSLPGIMPFVEGFEAGSADWELNNTNGGNNFSLTSSAAATGSNSIMIDNSTNAAGSASLMQTIKNYDLTTVSQPILVFKVAYQQKSSANYDKLQLFVSNTCGGGWISKWVRSGSGLATVSNTGTAPFVPSSSDFMTYTVNLYSVSSSHNVNFQWKFFADANGPGNNLYIDDINIVSGVTAITEHISESEIQVYPNPSTGNFSVSITLAAPSNVSCTVTDMIGQTIVSQGERHYFPGVSEIEPFDKLKCAPGIYFVNLRINDQVVSRKIIIE